MIRKKDSPREVRSIRFAEHEWLLIEARAAEVAKEPSAWIREVSVREARRELARTAPNDA